MGEIAHTVRYLVRVHAETEDEVARDVAHDLANRVLARSLGVDEAAEMRVARPKHAHSRGGLADTPADLRHRDLAVIEGAERLENPIVVPRREGNHALNSAQPFVARVSPRRNETELVALCH